MTATTPLVSARLALTPKTALAGLLDGAWWPRSRDLAAELPPLVDALEGRFGRITRVMVNPTCWPVVPHKVPVAGHTVHVGWFTEQDSDKMILLSYSVGRCDLLVIPPETHPAAAARLMTAASLPGNVRAVGTLMTDEAAAGLRIRKARSSEAAREAGGREAMSPERHPVVGARMIALPWNRWR
ncbi:hypothetical protein HYE82_11335 [Streptomyces sp. BR123]|uniref:DUF5994 family protein n=1 Tax=Streptomyces sp. BR123 TaxID=2749828 RepID=UPI0015C45586|nr:DUF5994 family protein [Streptomyces sp. BR123]NXY94977.1 hypothetical protein [Streptomyces sp. BR123]